MSLDFSRIRFDARNNFQGVLMQQGRVQLDADWNEWVAQIARRLQAGSLDSLGSAALPRETPDAFLIRATGGGLSIGPGRIYVDGILVENHGTGPDTWNRQLAEPARAVPLNYSAQPYLPNPPGLPGDGPYLVYLDVWQRELTYLQAPDLVEKAVGVDSTGRMQTVWQVKLLPGVGDIHCATPAEEIAGWVAKTRPSAGLLTTSTGDLSGEPDPCDVPPAAGYTGRENQLYRIEIHTGGGIGAATFKWSRDNATVASRVTHINPARDRLTVDSLGRDAVLRFNDGDWVEITDDWRELDNLPGDLRRIRLGGGVNDATRSIELDSALSAGLFPVNARDETDPERHTRIRRWDQAGQVRRADGSSYHDLDASGASGEILVPAAGTQLFLEHGILAEFDLAPAGGEFRSGDYWVFAARSVDGSIELLDQVPPLGIHHHYAPLAIVRWPDEVIDQRIPFNPAVGSIQVCAALHVDANGRTRALRQGQEVTVDQLAEGLAVLIRQDVDPNSVNDGSLFITTEIPYRLPPPYGDGSGGAVVAYQPVVLPAETGLLERGVLGWKPFAQTTAFLGDILQHDVPRLGDARFEREFDVYDNGGPASSWQIAKGNIVVQTEAKAGSAPNQQTTALPSMAVHHYKLKEGAAYVGLTVDDSLSGSVGLVYNWLSPKDFSLFVAREVWTPVGFSGAYASLVMSHAQVKGGKLVDKAQVDRIVLSGYSDLRHVNLDIKQVRDHLQFGCSAQVGSTGLVTVLDLDFPPVAALNPGSRLGVLTANTGTARFTRLQVVYGDEPAVTLIPVGLTSRLLTRLVLKRSLLAELAGAGGAPLSAAFAGPVPEADFETWFWLVPPNPGYYGYSYGYGSGYQGIGSGFLIGMSQ